MGLIQKIFGTHSENELKRIYPIVDAIEALEPEMQKLSDQELKEKTKHYHHVISFFIFFYTAPGHIKDSLFISHGTAAKLFNN